MPTGLDASQVKAVVSALRADGVYVDPSLRGTVTAADVSAISAKLAGHDPAVYVVAVPLTDAQSATALVTAAQKQLGTPGVFFVSRRDGGSWDLQAVKFGVVTNGADVRATFDAFDQHPKDLSAQLLAAVTAFTSGRTSRATSAPSSSPADGHSDGALPGWGAGAVVVLACLLAVVAVLWRRRRRPRSGGRRRATGARRSPAAAPQQDDAPSRGQHRR